MKQKIAYCMLAFLLTVWTSISFIPVANADDSAPTSNPSSTPTQNQSTSQSSDPAPNTQSNQNTTNANSSNTDTPTPSPSQNNTNPTPTPEASPTPSESPTPTPTPAADPSVAATNSATTADNITSTSSSGNNSVDISPTPTPETTPTPTPTPSASDSTATPTPTPTPNPTTLTTGNSTSITNQDNSVNTTSQNANLVYQTINIYDTQQGDLDLSAPLAAAKQAVTNDKNNDAVINIALSDNNYADVSNTIDSQANTGQNTLNSDGTTVVDTGNAYSVVSLLNTVNLVLVDSTVHVVTINIFGHLNGNIILPEPSSPPQTTPEPNAPCSSTNNNCSDSPASTTAVNNASVTNTVDSSANSGTNSATVTNQGNISTGNSQSVVDLANLINNFVFNGTFYRLQINTFGNWTGQFLGWAGFGPSDKSNLLLTSMGSSPNSSGGNGETIGISNDAIVSNTIHSDANSGNNSLTGSNANIVTGNAYSVVSLFNLINSSFIHSIGFFGFINIFGKFDGNIGGPNAFITPTPTPPDDTALEEASTQTNNGPQMDSGGHLEVTASNNVGAYVLPGDTVTFFITVKNTGGGRVYNSAVQIALMKDGVNVGGAVIHAGDIRQGGGAKIATGLVLSKSAAPGLYDAVITAMGEVGPDGSVISATADTPFSIFGSFSNSTIQPTTPPIAPDNASSTTPQVEAATTSTRSKSQKQNSNQQGTNNFAETAALFVATTLWGGLQILRRFV